MKSTFNTRSKLIVAITAMILVVLSVITGIISFAEYTKSSRAKRVIATYDGVGMLFSSNYLVQNSSLDPTAAVNRKRIYTTSTELSSFSNITVCNYAQGNPGKPNTKPITYVLSAKLVVVDGNVKRDAVAADLAAGMQATLRIGNVTKTFNASNLSDAFDARTLTANSAVNGGASADIYEIVLSKQFNNANNKVALYVAATPTPPIDGLTTIDAIFGSAVSAVSEQASWTGVFNEAGALDRTNATLPAPGDLDGFNYKISGSGAGTFKLSWNPALLTPNKDFIDEMRGNTPVGTETVGGVTWNYIAFSVDSDVISRYDTQFYYAEGVAAAGTVATWDDAASAVSYTYTEG